MNKDLILEKLDKLEEFILYCKDNISEDRTSKIEEQLFDIESLIEEDLNDIQSKREYSS